MKFGSRGSWLGPALLLAGLFATPLHLAVDAHEWHFEAAGGDHHHDSDDEHQTHPAVDHEVSALPKAPKLILAPAALDAAIPDLSRPDAARPVLLVAPEVEPPPEGLGDPPGAPRAPPF